MITSQLLMTVLWMTSGLSVGTLQDDNRQELRILTVQHAQAEMLSRQAIQLIGPAQVRPVVDGRTNRIIVSGPANEVERFAEIAKLLDVPSQENANVVTEVIRLKHRSPSAVIQPLYGELSGNGKLVEDQARNAIVVRDEESRVASVRRLIEELDVAPGMCSIEIQALSEDAEGGLSAELATALSKSGLSGYGVSMTAATKTIEGEEFSIDSRHPGGTLSVKGWARILDARKQVELRLRVEAVEGVSASISSTIRIPVGESVILGMTPHGGKTSRPLVLVVRATLP